MENKSSRKVFGRFWWLWFLVLFLSTQIGGALTMGIGIIPQFVVWIGIFLLSVVPLMWIGVKLLSKAQQADEKNNIPAGPFRNIFLPWPKAAIGLFIFVIVEAIILIPLHAYQLSPCGGVDIIRKIAGCFGSMPYKSSVISMDFSKDGKVFATSELDGNLQIWSYPDLALLNNLGDRGSYITKLSLSSNGEMIAIYDYKNPTVIIETKTGKTLLTLKQDDINDVKFSPDDRSVISISDSALQTWDVATGNLVNSIEQEDLEYLEIAPDGSFLVVADRSGTINILRARDNLIITSLQQPFLDGMAISKDGKYLLTASVEYEDSPDFQDIEYASTINIWAIKSGKVEHTNVFDDIQFNHIVSSRNSNSFAASVGSCFERGSILFETSCVYLWPAMDTNMPIKIRTHGGASSLTFSPTDDTMLIAEYPNVYIWRVP